MRVLLLPLGESSVAVHIETAREVMAQPELTSLPTAPAVVLGVVNRRGDVLVVFDTGVLVGVGRLGVEAVSHVAIVQCGPEVGALATVAAPTVVELAGAPQPPTVPWALGVYRLDEVPVVLVDPWSLLTHAGLGGDEPGAG